MNCSQKEITASSKIESRRNQNIYKNVVQKLEDLGSWPHQQGIWPSNFFFKNLASESGLLQKRNTQSISSLLYEKKQSPIIESISSGFTHNPHHLILDSVIDPKG